MQSNLAVFKLRDRNSEGCFIVLLSFAIFFLLLVGTPLFGSRFTFLIPLLTFVATLFIKDRWLTSKIKATADSQQLVLETLRLGYKAKDISGVFLWKDLERFYFDGWRGSTLRLLWANGEEHAFMGNNIYHFRTYLRRNFPEREKEW